MDDIAKLCSEDILNEMMHYTHLDYIFVSNIMLYTIIHGVKTTQQLRSFGIFNSFDTFIDLAGEISSYFKRCPWCIDDTKQRLCELASLTGYLQNDTEKWNTKDELAGLADGGEEHGLVGTDWLSTYKEAFVSMQHGKYPNVYPTFTTFEEYVKSNKWLTSGSCSIGEVTWHYDQEEGKFKAHKNMIHDIYTDEELWDIVSKWDGVLHSRAFIKDEVGKRRLAVASNIEAYLHESYILYLYGHNFKNWDGITLDESPQEQHRRNSKAINLLKRGAYALPFDFKRFDHQPQTKEIQITMSNIADQIPIPSKYLEDWRKIVNKVIQSYDNSEISMQIGNENVKHIVEGGLPSGVRSTSLTGNGWNGAITKIAIDTAEKVLQVLTVLQKMIKGDDTGLFVNTVSEAYLIRMCYAAINAVGSDAKFGISQNICEFLRNEISTTGVRGWSNRTIPTLTQRKPWNSEPWSPNAMISTLSQNTYLLERRLDIELPIIHNICKQKWSRYMGQSTRWLDLPKRLGGFGLYPWLGFVPDGKLPLISRPLIHVDNLKPRSIIEWTSLNEAQQHMVHKVNFSSKIATGDIVGPQKYFSKDFVTSFRKRKYGWIKEEVLFEVDKTTYPGVDEEIHWPKNQSKTIRSRGGKLPQLQVFLREYTLLKNTQRYDKSIEIRPLKDYLREYFPSSYGRLVNLESKGWHRTDAINIILGDMPTEPIKQLHPLLSAFVKNTIADKFNGWKGRRTIAKHLYAWTQATIERIRSSELMTMYNW
nr:MAG: putative RNA-dependent RNA polymerase [Totiviridae sp.]